MPILVLDFDGVLAIPWTNPVQLYPQIPVLLKQLQETHTLVLASFNPTAIRELRRFDVLQYFSATRAGVHDNVEITEFLTNLGELCKAKQIASMQEQHLADKKDEDYHFFDDDPYNLEQVTKLLPHVKCHYIDEDVGLTADRVLEALTLL
jgi:predicted phosphatase